MSFHQHVVLWCRHPRTCCQCRKRGQGCRNLLVPPQTYAPHPLIPIPVRQGDFAFVHLQLCINATLPFLTVPHGASGTTRASPTRSWCPTPRRPSGEPPGDVACRRATRGPCWPSTAPRRRTRASAAAWVPTRMGRALGGGRSTPRATQRPSSSRPTCECAAEAWLASGVGWGER